MRSRISIRGVSVHSSVSPLLRWFVRQSVGPAVRPSVRPSVRRSIRRSHTSWNFEKWAEFEQNSIRNIKLCHLKDDSKTSTRAVNQNASVVRTLFDLFFFLFFLGTHLTCANAASFAHELGTNLFLLIFPMYSRTYWKGCVHWLDDLSVISSLTRFPGKS